VQYLGRTVGFSSCLLDSYDVLIFPSPLPFPFSPFELNAVHYVPCSLCDFFFHHLFHFALFELLRLFCVLKFKLYIELWKLGSMLLHNSEHVTHNGCMQIYKYTHLHK
jgi:hypothetical protein